MKTISRFTLSILAPIALSGAACVGSGDDAEDRTDDAAQAVQVKNALTSNALTSNALTSNALTSNALTSNSLTSNSLTSNALTREALHDPDARTVLRYIVGCALSPDQSFEIEVDGETYSYRGELGLAEGWGDGECNGDCRSWVSGCVISRINYLGERVSISVRGERKELSSSKLERALYAHQEAAYYGDIFAEDPRYYACLPLHRRNIERVCGESIDDCIVDVIGTCNAACDKARDDGSFPHCRDKARGFSGKFPGGTTTYKGSITVFLQQ